MERNAILGHLNPLSFASFDVQQERYKTNHPKAD
jgi:hypothetical protein